MSELYNIKKVNVLPYQDGYTVMSLMDQVSPGVCVKVHMEQNTWYDIEVYCERRLGPPVGLWISTLDNKTIFFGEFVNNKQSVKKSIFNRLAGDLLLGLLFQGMVRKNHSFFFKDLTVSKREVQPQGTPLTQHPYQHQIQQLQQQIQQLQAKAIQQQQPIRLSLTKEASPVKMIEAPVIQQQLLSPPSPSATQAVIPFQSSLDILRNLLQESHSKEEDTLEEPVQDHAVPYIYEIQYAKQGIEFTNRIVCTQDTDGNDIYPICFGIPEELVVPTIPQKVRDFAISYVGTGDPLSSLSCSEEEYWKNLELARFLYVPHGIERVSQYEALAKGCIPYLADLSRKNQFLPHSVLEKMYKLEGLHPGYIDTRQFQEDVYQKYADFFLGYTRSFLTTKAMARYLLHTMNQSYAKKVLFLGWAYTKEEIELQASLLHGLKLLLGSENVVDVPAFTPIYKGNMNVVEQERMKLPKHGYTYWFRLPDATNRGNIEKRIEEKEFDLVIVMGVFTEEIRKQQRLKKGEFPYSKQIMLSYEKEEIAFVDGHEDPSKTEDARKMLAGKGVFFRR